jgi:hypothetical protein
MPLRGLVFGDQSPDRAFGKVGGFGGGKGE